MDEALPGREQAISRGPITLVRGLEESACQLKNEGHWAAGVYERPR